MGVSCFPSQLTRKVKASAAAARSLDIPLVSADRKLLQAGLAESTPHIVERLGLDVGTR